MRALLSAVFFLFAVLAPSGVRADCLLEAPTLVDRIEFLQVERFNRRQLSDTVFPFLKNPAPHVRERTVRLQSFLEDSPLPRQSLLPFYSALCEELTPSGVSTLVSGLEQPRFRLFFEKLAQENGKTAPSEALPAARHEALSTLASLFALPTSLENRFQALHRQAVEWVYPRAVETLKLPPGSDYSLAELTVASEHLTDAGLVSFVEWMSSEPWKRLFQFLAKRRVDNLETLLSRAQVDFEKAFPLQDNALRACERLLSQKTIPAGFWQKYAVACSELFVFPGLHERLATWTKAGSRRERWQQLVSSLQARECGGSAATDEARAFCAYHPKKPRLTAKEIKAVSRAFFRKHFEENHGDEWATSLDRVFWARYDQLFSP